MPIAVKLSLALVPLLLLLALALPHGETGAQTPTVQVAVDVDVTGNEANSLGPTEACNETPLQVGDTLEIDLVVRGVPEQTGPTTGGIGGFELDLLFDSDVLYVEEVLAFSGPTILAAQDTLAPLWIIDYLDGRKDEHWPEGKLSATSGWGDVRMMILDINTHAEHGDGILTRVRVEAIGEGSSPIFFGDALHDDGIPNVYDIDGDVYGAILTNATIIVGDGVCPDSPPTPTASPPPTAPPPTVPPTTSPATPTGPPPSPTPTPPPVFTGTPTRAPPEDDEDDGPRFPEPAALPRGGGGNEPSGASPALVLLTAGALALGAGAFAARRARR